MSADLDTPNLSADAEQEFVGYGAAAEYLQMNKGTLSSYCSEGYGPVESGRRPDRQYLRPVFTRSELDRWKRERPGRGARTDLQSRVDTSTP